MWPDYGVGFLRFEQHFATLREPGMPLLLRFNLCVRAFTSHRTTIIRWSLFTHNR